MTDRIPPPPPPQTAAAVAAANAAIAPSFAEAQRRLATRRSERAAAEAATRAQIAATEAARREAAAAALRARLDAGGPLASSSSPLVRRLGDTALIAWDGVSRAASTISNTLNSGNDSRNIDVAGTSGQRPAFRVSQVDAELLDEELLDLLRGQVADALKYIRGGTLQDDWQPEIMLLLRAALFKLSVWDHDATYGAALQNLKYADARATSGKRGAIAAAVPLPPSKWQKAAYGLVTVGGRYAWTKWEDWLRDHDEEADDGYGESNESNDNNSLSFLSGRLRLSLSSNAVKRLARVTNVASDLYAGAAFVSFLVFLRYGRYRTLLDRILRMRLVPPTSQVSREVSFEYLNRQLVWHAFTEFLLFLLPLVGINRWRRWLTRTWRKTKSAVAKATTAVKGSSDNEDDNGDVGKTGEYAFLPERTCAICYQDQNAATSEADIMAAAAASSGVIGSAETDITNPYEAVPCGCVYCYVSLATRIEREEGDGWTCLRCGAIVTSCRPWNGNVLEPASVLASAAGGATTADGRPSSSSTNASGSPSYTQKTVGFADDVKGEDEDEEDDEASNDEIQIGEIEDEEEIEDDVEEDDVEEDDGEDDGEDGEDSADVTDDESEAYEEDEDSIEGELDDDLEEA
ncbi:peroxisome assembly protein (Peroxin-2) [Sporothrix stenoceras]|uniref:Peroxisome assembly protein (Peroxin-2) n=1 Tax=Sporothrix stenoceras TaxID=5173 RepID=A0ABR3YJW8_9PEZI